MKNEKIVRLPNLFEAVLPIFTMVSLMIYVFVFAKDGKENIYDAGSPSTYLRDYCCFSCRTYVWNKF